MAKGTPYEVSQETLERLGKQALATSEMIAQVSKNISKSLEPTLEMYQNIFKSFQATVHNFVNSDLFTQIVKNAHDAQRKSESINVVLPQKKRK